MLCDWKTMLKVCVRCHAVIRKHNANHWDDVEVSEG